MGAFMLIFVMGLLLERLYGWKLMLKKIMVKDPLARKLLQVCSVDVVFLGNV